MLALAVSCGPLWSSSARAQSASRAPDTPEVVRARQLYRDGVRYFDSKQYDRAVRAFRDSFRLHHHPDTLRNLGAAEFRSGQTAAAARDLAAYLRDPAATDPAARKEAKKYLGQAAKKLGRFSFKVQPAGARIQVDAHDVGTAPVGFAWYVEPGDHAIVVASKGYKQKSVSAVAEAGQLKTIDVVLAPTGSSASGPAEVQHPATAGPAQPADGNGHPAPGAAGHTSTDPGDTAPHGRAGQRSAVPAIIGGAIGVTGIVLGAIWEAGSSSDANQADKLLKSLGPSPCGPGTPYAAECIQVRDDNNSSRRKADLAVGAFVVGGVALAGTALYWFWPRHSDATAYVQPRVLIGRQQASFDLQGRF